MSEWREQKLDSIATLSKDTWKVGDEDAQYIGMEHIAEGTLRLSGIGDSNSVNSNKYRFNKGQFLFGKLRPYFRKVVRPKFDGVCSTDIWVIQPRNNIDADFAFYLFASQEFVDLAYSSASGTRMPRADWNFMKETEWFIPMEEKEQRAIAAVLSSLDDKIDLLHRQNATLEAMAQSLFRQWFVEEAEEDWEDGKLGGVIEIFDSQRVPISKMQRNKMKEGKLYPYYGAAKIMDFVNDYIFDGEYILLGEDGTVRTDEGYPILQYATGKFWVNNHTHIFQAKKPYSNFFIWNFLKKKNITKIVTGAVQPKINQTNLKSLDFPLAPLDLIAKFDEATEDIFKKIKANNIQIRTLEKLRDTLLPKLMSGEVRVDCLQGGKK